MSHARLLELRSKLDDYRTMTVPATVEAREESRSDGEGDVLILEGHAAVFDSATVIDYGSVRFKEVIRRGAFRKLLATKPDVVLQFDHEGQPMARTNLGEFGTPGALELTEDTRGLKYRAVVARTQLSKDVHELVRTGVLNGCSFTFRVAENGDHWEDPAQPAEPGDWGTRYVLEVERMKDVGPVTTPAYDDTDVQARNEPAAADAERRDDPETADTPDGETVEIPEHALDASDDERGEPVDDLEWRTRLLELSLPPRV